MTDNIISKKDFIKRAEDKYEKNFDYENINYKTYARGKITLVCQKHDVCFDISPINHIVQINGGCNMCRKENKKIIVLNKNEEYKSVNVDDYKNNYFISNFGKIISKTTNKEIKQHGSCGYIKVHLHSEKVNKIFTVHYLVYVTFHNKDTSDKVIDHIDGNKHNNNSENLRLVTQSDNIKNAYKNNTKMYKQKNIKAFKDDVFVKEFSSTKDAKDFINHKNTSGINNVLNGKIKTAGGYTWKYTDEEVAENKKQKYIKISDQYKSIEIIEGEDYSKYSINKNGIIVNTNSNNRKIKDFLQPDGYKRVYLYDEKNIKKGFLLHRLIAKFFLPDGNIYYSNNDYVVNHINKDKSNNSIENLEWTTIKNNVIHGCGKKIAKIDKITNLPIKIYDTITDAYKELDKPWNSLISKVCNDGYGRKTIYGFKWKYID